MTVNYTGAKCVVLSLLTLFISMSPAKLYSSQTNQGEEVHHTVGKTETNNDIIRTHKPIKAELYIMSHCPYGISALKQFLPITPLIPGLILKIRFITGTDKKGRLRSLHGKSELLEDRIWAILIREYPDKFRSFFDCRIKEPFTLAPWKCLKEVGISHEEIQGKLRSGIGKKYLLDTHKELEKNAINASPTLFLNGEKYQGTFSSKSILSYACSKLEGMKKSNSTPCKTTPVCFTDSDCTAGNKRGQCLNSGSKDASCSYSSVAIVPVTIIEANSTVFPREDLRESTVRFFPGANIKNLPYPSKESKRLLEKFGIEILPGYIFGHEVKDSDNFSIFQEGFIPVGQSYTYNPVEIKANFFYLRKRKPMTVNIFVSPLSEKSYQFLEILKKEERKGRLNTVINYFVVRGKDRKPTTHGGEIGIEEICRQKALNELYPELMEKYFIEKAKKLKSSYWEEAFEKIMVDPYRIKDIAQGSKKSTYIGEELKISEDLRIEEENSFLINNQELIIIHNRDDLYQMINKLSTIK